jgi:dihydropteroate synthase
MAGTLRLGGRTFAPGELVVMAIVNRTPDSFFDRGATFASDSALRAVERAVTEGAEIIDIGGVKAGPGDEVDVAEEIRRTVDTIAAVRTAFPDVVISIDTWRAEVAVEAVAAGADLLNDTWSGADPALARVAAATGAGLVCSHAGGLAPRTRPHRAAFDDVVADVVTTVTGLAERALEITRRLAELTDTGWPLLVALSNKDFIGETLDLPVPDRLEGTLAATAVSAWLGARVFRAHQVRQTRRVLDMVASIRGDRPPTLTRRGLA